MSYSLESRVDSAEQNIAWLYINGDNLNETSHVTHSSYYRVNSTGGRMVTVEASAGDKIEIRTTRMEGEYWQILYCAEYIPKM